MKTLLDPIFKPPIRQVHILEKVDFFRATLIIKFLSKVEIGCGYMKYSIHIYLYTKLFPYLYCKNSKCKIYFFPYIDLDKRRPKDNKSQNFQNSNW